MVEDGVTELLTDPASYYPHRCMFANLQEPATVEIRESIAELMAELEMTLTQQKLIELRQQELERLAVLAKRRRKFESFDGGSEEHAQHRGRRLMDLASLQERKARFEAVVSDAHEHSNAVKAQQAEEHEEAERIRAAEDELLRKLAAHRAETIVAQRALEDRCTNARREPLAFFNKIDTTRNGRMSREDFQRPGAREHIARFMKDRIEIYDLTVDELIEEVADKPYLAFLKAVNRPVRMRQLKAAACQSLAVFICSFARVHLFHCSPGHRGRSSEEGPKIEAG